jgi:hypothetical protein
VSPLAGVGTELKAQAHTAEHHCAEKAVLLLPEPVIGDDKRARSNTNALLFPNFVSHGCITCSKVTTFKNLKKIIK